MGLDTSPNFFFFLFPLAEKNAVNHSVAQVMLLLAREKILGVTVGSVSVIATFYVKF